MYFKIPHLQNICCNMVQCMGCCNGKNRKRSRHVRNKPSHYRWALHKYRSKRDKRSCHRSILMYIYIFRNYIHHGRCTICYRDDHRRSCRIHRNHRIFSERVERIIWGKLTLNYFVTSFRLSLLLQMQRPQTHSPLPEQSTVASLDSRQ